jgi:hypothetical protein
VVGRASATETLAGTTTATTELAAQSSHDLTLLREAALLLLREDDLAVGEDVELPASASGDLGGDAEFPIELGRETRGTCVVAASGRAVENLDGHAGTLVRWS